jgi:hypothetical protein
MLVGSVVNSLTGWQGASALTQSLLPEVGQAAVLYVGRSPWIGNARKIPALRDVTHSWNPTGGSFQK